MTLEDIVIESDDLVVNKASGVANFSGKVIVWFDEAVLKTTGLQIMVRDIGKKRTLEKIVIPHKLTAMNSKENEVIIADGAEYIVSEKMLRFQGNIYMQKDQHLVKCDELMYLTKIQKIGAAD